MALGKSGQATQAEFSGDLVSFAEAVRTDIDTFVDALRGGREPSGQAISTLRHALKTLDQALHVYQEGQEVERLAETHRRSGVRQ